MKKVLTALTAVIAAAGCITALALSAVQLAAFDEKRYERAYDRYGRYEFIGISKPDLMRVTADMLDYLKGSREDLLMYADIRGQRQQVFEERELLHMEDVRGLFAGGFLIRSIGAAAAVLGIAALIFLSRKKWLKNLSIAYLALLGITVLLAGLLLAAVMTNFSDLFIKFHLMFFDNDLWLLDIDTDVLIQMFPEEFFNSMALAAGVYSIVALVVPGIAAAVCLIRQKRRKRGSADAV